jgi:hypothetical protein
MGLLHLKLLEIGGGEGHLPKAFCVEPAQAHDPRAESTLTNGLDPHRFAEQRSCYYLPLD